MTADNLEVLVSVPSEVEAAAIVSGLAERGIEAQATGGLTAGFKAEAPGEVRVLVSAAEAERARGVLAEIHREPTATEAAGGSIIFDCDLCGKQVVFPADTRGSIQSCPECGEWLDVPEG